MLCHFLATKGNMNNKEQNNQGQKTLVCHQVLTKLSESALARQCHNHYPFASAPTGRVQASLSRSGHSLYVPGS